MEFVRNETAVYVPYLKVTVKFFEKEEVSLNAFQKFLLEAIIEGASIQQIMDSTQLTKNVVELELLQMETQKLIYSEGSKYFVTDISKKIMMISKTVDALSSQENSFCVNLITGEIEKIDDSIFCMPEKNAYILRQKILNLDGISIYDNMDFFAENIETFSKLETEEIQTVLSSIYAEFSALKEETNQNIFYYKKRNLIGLPCLIGEEKIDGINQEASILIEAMCNLISFSFTTESLEKYADILPTINELNTRYPELISDEAKRILHDELLCESYNKNTKKFIYDCTSGNYRLSNEITINSVKRKAQLVVGEINPLNEDVKKEMVNKIKDMLEIISEEVVVQVCVTSDVYKVELDFMAITEE